MKAFFTKKIFASLCLVLVLGAMSVPLSVGAVSESGAVTAGGATASVTSALDPGYLIVCGRSTPDSHPCTVDDFFVLARRVMNLIFYLTIPVVFYVCAYAGWLYMSATDDSAKITKAKKMFKGVIIGFLFVCGAWLIVFTIVDPILNKNAYSTFGTKDGAGN